MLSATILQARLRDNAGLIGVGVLLLLLFAIGGVLTDRFTRPANLLNVYEQATDLAFVAIGQTCVILTGGIDLSVGSLISLIACLTSGLIQGNPANIAPVVAGLLALATALGGLNALLVIFLRVHPLIVTLGMNAVLQGVTCCTRSGRSARCPPDSEASLTGVLPASRSAPLSRSSSAWWSRCSSATSPSGAASSRLATTKRRQSCSASRARTVLFLVYGFSGFCCGLTAIYLVSRFGVGQPYTGVNYTLASITPVIVGGTLLSGGRGSVVGSLIGAYLIMLLNNLLNFLDISKHYQLVAQALIIILAVSVYVERRRTV